MNKQQTFNKLDSLDSYTSEFLSRHYVSIQFNTLEEVKFYLSSPIYIIKEWCTALLNAEYPNTTFKDEGEITYHHNRNSILEEIEFSLQKKDWMKELKNQYNQPRFYSINGIDEEMNTTSIKANAKDLKPTKQIEGNNL